MLTIKLPPGADAIIKALQTAGYEAYIVGGCVRDAVMGVPPHDWDICTNATPEQVTTTMNTRDATILETGIKHGTVTILMPDDGYEVTTYRTEGNYSDGRHPDFVLFTSSLLDDLSRRDFTMNAMAYVDGTLVDPFGGENDIMSQTIRCVGNPEKRFQEDGLRIMRALRFSARLGFHIEPFTAQAIKDNKDLLAPISAERKRAELSGLIMGDMAASVMRDFKEVLAVIIPEIAPTFDFNQNNPNHIYDLWEHTLHAVDAAPKVLVTRLAAFLHDLGKPSCCTTDPSTGISHYYDHPKASYIIAQQALVRLKYSNDEIEHICALVKSHDFPLAENESDLYRQVRRLLNRLSKDWLFDLFDVMVADVTAHSPSAAYRITRVEMARKAANDILSKNECFCIRDLAINGNDIMSLGYESGPIIGELLNILLTEVIDGRLPNNAKTLLDYVIFLQH